MRRRAFHCRASSRSSTTETPQDGRESGPFGLLRDGVIVGLANHTLLISKDGTERPIDDSAAPIRNKQNEVAGVVLVFRDITERYRQEQHLQDALDLCR